jgi:putative transposase
LQNVATRVDLAYQAFFRRVKAKKGKAGFPRFKSWFRYDSFTYPQSGFKINEDKSVVQLSKIGRIKIKYHRPIEGKIKSCNVKRSATGKWFVSFSCDIDSSSKTKQFGRACGIDVGLESFATLSNGKQIENPRFFRKEEKALAKAQRRLSKQKKGTAERFKARKVVARVHERIKNKRHNFAHQLSRKLVTDFKTIVVEDLSINNMKKSNFKCINKSIGDAAWRMFADLVEYKAEEAGTQFVKVNPAFTSQTCARCGSRAKKTLSQRIHKCSCCNFSLQRDHNAAINILALGQQSLASA